MIKTRIVKIVSLILIALVLATYYPLFENKFNRDPLYTYKDITGQDWQVINNNPKKKEYPINVIHQLSSDKVKLYNKLIDESVRLEKIMDENQEAHEHYNDSTYTGGLTFEILGINGGNSLSDYEVTSIIHEELQKRLQYKQNLYIDAANKSSDINKQINELESEATDNAWDLRYTVNNVRVILIIFLLILIFSKKLWRLIKIIFSFILND